LFFVEKYQPHTSGVKNTKNTAKNIFLSDGTDFLKEAKEGGRLRPQIGPLTFFHRIVLETI
jgi:hypothetical protein